MSRTQITDELIDEIRERYAAGWSQGRLARTYQGLVSLTYIGRIVRNEVRVTEATRRTQDEITMLRRNPSLAAEQKREADASARRVWAMLHPGEPIPEVPAKDDAK
jgi:hypothetical protein